MYYTYNRYQEPEEPDDLNGEGFDSTYDDSFQYIEEPMYYSYRNTPDPFEYQYDARQFSPSAPPGPPPTSIPAQPQQIQSFGGPGGPGGPQPFVDPGAIRPCLFRFVYIWPRRGQGFWAWLTFIGRRSASGFRWNGRRWIYFGIDLRDIRSFQCF